jgi:hypothetical protein
MHSRAEAIVTVGSRLAPRLMPPARVRSPRTCGSASPAAGAVPLVRPDAPGVHGRHAEHARRHHGDHGRPAGEAGQEIAIRSAYLAFTIGMTFQVSDTDIKSKAIRRTVLRHAWLSFPLVAVIIATSINLVSGLAK